jgi:hypothetical protein
MPSQTTKTPAASTPRRLLALAIGLVVLVFGGSAAICATMPSWPSPAMFVLGTIALPFLALGAVLPTRVPIVIVWTWYRGVMGWLDQWQVRQAASGPDHTAVSVVVLKRGSPGPTG